jgi:hypothetical protein
MRCREREGEEEEEEEEENDIWLLCMMYRIQPVQRKEARSVEC